MGMMRINLIPHKTSRRQDVAQRELLIFSAILVTCLVGLFVWWQVTTNRITKEQRRLDALRSQLNILQEETSRVEEIKHKAETVERRLAVVQTLQKSKVGPARLLDELATILNNEKSVWLTKLDERDGTLRLEGAALEHENISNFQMALTTRLNLFTNVRLLLVNTVKKGNAQILEWSIVCQTHYSEPS